MNKKSLLIKNISKLIGIMEKPYLFKKGRALSDIKIIEKAFLLIEGKYIHSFGTMEECPENVDTIIDASESMVLPAWVDSHTHIVFPSTREKEFVDKIKGLSYEEIAKRGGGILNTAKKMTNTSEDFLLDNAMQRINEMISYGTGAVEIKSGYGLSFDNEIKMLRVIKKLKEKSPIPVKATFLGAHAIPAEYQSKRQEYINLIVDKMLPYIGDNDLADYIDVFCDRGFFTVEETDKILKAGVKYGLKPKIHANELDFSGGVQVGVKNNAISVDHLEHIGNDEIKLLKNNNTIPTLLPSTAFFLRLDYSPARKMIDSGLGVALASDYNPGSSPSGNMQFVMSLASIYMKMLPEEVVNAATINAALALELENKLGSISKGKIANLIITKPFVNNIAQIPYFFGNNIVENMIINGTFMT